MDPIVTLQDINTVDRPGKPMAKIPKIIILGYGKGDSCQISAIKNVNSLLRAVHQFFEKILQSVYSAMSSNMFGLGELSLQLAASNLPLTNKPTLHE